MDKRIYLINNALEQIQAIKNTNRTIRKMEIQMEKQIKEFLKKIQLKILYNVKDNASKEHVKMTFQENEEKYKKIIEENAMKSSQYGRNKIIRELQRAGYSIIFNEFDTIVRQFIIDSRLQLAEKTLQRLPSEITDILVDGYERGLGIDDIANNIQKKFSQYNDYDAVMIARTEINGASNMGAFKTLEENNIEYIQWITAADERVRGQRKTDKANHIKLHEQITRRGSTFENGLRYPHDPNGHVAEIVNCRCTVVPFFIPSGYRIPDLPYFYPSDLVKIK